MKQTFIGNSQPLNCVKTFPSVFNKAIIQYPVKKQKITGRHVEPQKRSSHSINKSDLLKINLTEAKPGK